MDIFTVKWNVVLGIIKVSLNDIFAELDGSGAIKNIISYNLGHNILRPFDVLPNFSFTTSETNCDS